MNNLVAFQNPGVIDPRLITTMGCNVKENENPIGFFGTGLKYALAVLMREEQQVKIWAGGACFEISTKKEEIRGKEFSIVLMNGAPLGFTTELGKQWSLENAYRELYCNALDEGGDVSRESDAPWEGHTVVEVYGEAFSQVHEKRGDFILRFSRKRKLFELPGVGEIYDGPGDQMFYKGIAVGKTPDSGFFYTFNSLKTLELSEDRTFISDYAVHQRVCELIANCTDQDIIRNSIGRERTAEAHLDFHWNSCGEAFYQTVSDMIAAFGEEGVLENAKRALFKAKGVPKMKFREIILTSEEERMLTEGLDFWLSAGIDIREFEIKFVSSVASTPDVKILAAAYDGKIYLTPEAFSPELLKLALLEEWVHLKHQVRDETRNMQNVLFKMILDFARRLRS